MWADLAPPGYFDRAKEQNVVVAPPEIQYLQKRIHALIERMCSAQDAQAACKRTMSALRDSVKVHNETIRDCQNTIGRLEKELKKEKHGRKATRGTQRRYGSGGRPQIRRS